MFSMFFFREKNMLILKLGEQPKPLIPGASWGLLAGSMFCPGSEPSPHVANAGAALIIERPADTAAAWRNADTADTQKVLD